MIQSAADLAGLEDEHILHSGFTKSNKNLCVPTQDSSWLQKHKSLQDWSNPNRAF